MFKFIGAVIKKYISLFDDIFVDFLSDIKSLRYQLILWAFVYNFYIVAKSPDNIKFGIALLTAVYAFYFYSKDREHARKLGMDPDLEDTVIDPPSSREE